MTRNLTYTAAILEALDQSMAADDSVYIMGLGVPDPKSIFGTTKGLADRYGPGRVLDMPCAENAMTGVALGSALAGQRPVLVHQRLDFALLAVEQMVNQAAKWRYMFGGRMKAPMVIRMIVGRGWGQGPQHSQSLHSWFAHIPGIKVVAPVTPHDAKGLLISAIEDDDPVLYFEHRWLHHITGPVPDGLYRTPIGPARIAREGSDLTIAAVSYMVLEALHAAKALESHGVSAEVLDLRSIKPLDRTAITASVRKTGRLIVADTSWSQFGTAAEVAAIAAEDALDAFKSPPRRLGLPDCPVPTSPALAKEVYPRARQIFEAAAAMLDLQGDYPAEDESPTRLDVPVPTFTGPF